MPDGLAGLAIQMGLLQLLTGERAFVQPEVVLSFNCSFDCFLGPFVHHAGLSTLNVSLFFVMPSWFLGQFKAL